MNILKFLPKKLRRKYEKNIINSGIKIHPKNYIIQAMFMGFILSSVISLILFFFNINAFLSLIIGYFVIEILIYLRISLKVGKRIRRMESVFPDFIQLMSSNLRAGMTVEKAFLSSARPELHPLDKEILKTGREIATGRDIVSAFKEMGERIDSEKIQKVISLIITGLKAGGNISTLLETTSSNMREKEFLEKKASSNVLMYVIFIFVAIGVGAPVLFGLSSILLEIIIKLTSSLPAMETTQMNLPFTLSKVSISPNFVIYFSLAFLVITDIISSLVIGLVNKGEEKYGLKYALPLILSSLSIFFIIRVTLSKYLFEAFSIFG